MLSAKLVGRKTSVAQPTPQKLLCPGVALAQGTRDGRGFCVLHSSEVNSCREGIQHRVSPHPGPLPWGEGAAPGSHELSKSASGEHRAATRNEPAEQSPSPQGRGPG